MLVESESCAAAAEAMDKTDQLRLIVVSCLGTKDCYDISHGWGLHEGGECMTIST